MYNHLFGSLVAAVIVVGAVVASAVGQGDGSVDIEGRTEYTARLVDEKVACRACASVTTKAFFVQQGGEVFFRFSGGELYVGVFYQNHTSAYFAFSGIGVVDKSESRLGRQTFGCIGKSLCGSAGALFVGFAGFGRARRECGTLSYGFDYGFGVDA